jgi:outer membrane protein
LTQVKYGAAFALPFSRARKISPERGSGAQWQGVGPMKKALLGALALGVIASISFSGATAKAADLNAPVLKAAAPVAFNPWMIRLRALTVVPRDSVSIDQLPGTGASWNTAVVPELDISYFFTPNFAAELILGVTRHHATGNGISGAVNLNGVDIGKAWLLPPTLTFQYHFTDFGAFKPYVGAGVNYTIFFNQSAGNTATNGVAITQLHFNNAWGFALQAGFDYMLDAHWGINFDAKKLFLRPTFDATANGALPLTGRANLDPWLIAGGITYKF